MARECELGVGADRQVWGALVPARSDSEALARQVDEDEDPEPRGTGAMTCFPWEGYYQDDQLFSPAPSPMLETFLSSLMFGE